MREPTIIRSFSPKKDILKFYKSLTHLLEFLVAFKPILLWNKSD
jgi:hypothetical protein